MKPQVKQRWVFYTTSENYIVEITAIDYNVNVIVIQVLSNDGYRKVGSKYESAGLQDILRGYPNAQWTYLEGQDAP